MYWYILAMQSKKRVKRKIFSIRESGTSGDLMDLHRLQYEEYYPNALADTYKGVSGYIYSCNHLEKCEKGNIGIPDVYVSSVPVKVDFCEYIEDAYTELLLAEEKGLIKIVRYEKFIQKGEAWLRKVIREEYENNFDHPEYQFFLKCKFSEITIHCENISINSPGSH